MASGLPRSLEAVAAGAGLLFLTPVLAVAATLVRTTTKGPALFRQTRVGRHGRPFTLYKLRSMRMSEGGPTVTSSHDSRITPIGALIRRTKVDELPQLWNVLRGDLSLVGPRPEVPEYVDSTDPLWLAVLDVRPGITDPITLRLRSEEALLAQVEDPHSFYVKTLLPYKLQGNLEYLRRRTWRSDVGVLIRTVLAVVAPRRAPTPTPAEIVAAVHHGPS
ncbi:MAG: sugar transferase [Thermoleophilia bacterium]